MLFRFLFLFLSLYLNTACNSLHSLKKNPSDKELFQHASKLKEKSYYKEALTYFKQLKTRFLYSRLAKEADLAIADIYFAQKEWEKATRSYGHFSELHPQHPQTDRVLFHLALSYFHQLPTTEDRDLSLSKKTLFHLNKHLKLFQKSAYRSAVQEYKQRVLYLLAQKQWMIARFHLNQGKPHSALPYMLNLMQDYSFLLPTEENNKSKIQAQKEKKITSSLIQLCDELHSPKDSFVPSHGLKCLKIIANKKMDESAVRFCGQLKKTSPGEKDNRWECLKFIAGRKINNSALRFCSQLKQTAHFKTEHKWECLKSLAVFELPTLKSLKKRIQELRPKAITFLNSTKISPSHL